MCAVCNKKTVIRNWSRHQKGSSGASVWPLRAQIVKVTSVIDSDTVDISPALYSDYNTAFSPQGKKANIKLEGISVEDLTIDNSTSDAPNVFYIYDLFDSSFQNLDINGIPSGNQSRHFHLYNSLWLSIKNSKII